MGFLDERVVWVTGSARRLGREMALAAAREGARVVVHYHRSAESAKATAREIEALGSEALVVKGDLTSPEVVAAIVTLILGRFRRLDALVCSAGTYPRMPFMGISREEFMAAIGANLYAPFLCVQKCLPLLTEARPGRVILLTDWAVARPYRYRAHYMAAKGGLDTLTRALARELAPGILVNAIAPGPVLEPEDITPSERQAVLSRIPLARWGTPDAVVQAMLYLLRSDYATGSTIVVDGGRSLG